MRSRVLANAYRYVDPDEPCPTCQAAPKAWCVNPVTGQIRRIPCLRRPRIPGAMTPLPIDVDVVHVDFTQPRHPTERTALP